MSDVVDAVHAFGLKTLFACVKHDLILDFLASWLTESLRPAFLLCLLRVDTRTWDFSLLVVLVENLIVVE